MARRASQLTDYTYLKEFTPQRESREQLTQTPKARGIEWIISASKASTDLRVKREAERKGG